MSEAETHDTVLRLLARIAPEMDAASIDPGKPLQRELDIDSFDFLNLLVAIRDELGVTVAESDYDQVRTLDELVRYLEARL